MAKKKKIMLFIHIWICNKENCNSSFYSLFAEKYLGKLIYKLFHIHILAIELYRKSYLAVKFITYFNNVGKKMADTLNMFGRLYVGT